MKKLCIVFCFISAATQAQSNLQLTLSSKETLQSFFTNFGNGDLEGILSVFADSAKIISINKNGLEGASLYGTFNGKEGIKTFLNILATTFETKSFEIHQLISEGNIAFATGSFVHKVRATGKLFESDWALMCKVYDGKITEYHFFEDSASFMHANQ